MKNAIVIGYGSIGQRHVRLLKELKLSVSIVSRRQLDIDNCYETLEQALIKEDADYIVVSNETNLHENTLTQILELNFQGKVLIEKPLFNDKPIQYPKYTPLYVGYNLRFHPIIQKLKNLLKGQKVLSVNCYVGQYLPTWRPNTNYKSCYSASTAKGGGAIRDLSHELDYLSYLFGDWNELTASGGTYSSLKIQSDDLFNIIYLTKENVQVAIEMNYLDRIIQRQIIIQTDELTIKADLIKNSLQINDQFIKYTVEKDYTYLQQHLAIINNQTEILCDFEQGLDCIQMIEAAEKASEQKVWIKNG